MKSIGQLVKPSGKVSVASAVDAELARRFQALARRRDSNVSAELRRLVIEALACEDRRE